MNVRQNGPRDKDHDADLSSQIGYAQLAFIAVLLALSLLCGDVANLQRERVPWRLPGDLRVLSDLSETANLGFKTCKLQLASGYETHRLKIICGLESLIRGYSCP